MEISSNSFVSPPAFSSLLLGEKSTDPPNHPIINSPHIHTTDGLISPTDVSRLDIKENELSSNSTSTKAPNMFLPSNLKNTKAPLKAPIDLRKVFHDNQENEFTEYQQIPRQIFMSTICHVSKSTLSETKISLSFDCFRCAK